MITTSNILAQTRTGTWPTIGYTIKADGLIVRPAGTQGRLFDRNITSSVNDVIGAAAVGIRRGIPRRSSVLEKIHGPRVHLRDQIQLDLAHVSTEAARVHTSSDIMVFVEKDTKAHVIEPVNARALKFVSRGRTIFAKRVHHPGTKGKHVWQRADAAVAQRLIRAVDAAITAAFQGVAYVRRFYRASP